MIYRSIGLIGTLLIAGCSRPAPAKTYAVHGQIMAVDAAKQTLTIKHEDIDGLMPGMTMTFPVADAKLLTGREPGELVDASLEVTDAVGRVTSVSHVGFTPLPTNTNAAIMAEGVLEVGQEVPDAAFIDQSDTRRSFSEWRGMATLVTFIYTRCPLPDFCPLIDSHFARLQQAILADPALRAKVRLVSISFDPDHDTPAVLKQHAATLKADPAVWTFLTGDRATLDRFAARLGVAVMRPDGETSITHNLRTTLVGPDGRIVSIYSGSVWKLGEVLMDFRRAAGIGQRP